MSWWRTMLGLAAPDAAASGWAAPQVSAGEMISVSTPEELEQALRRGTGSASGQSVTPESAMRVIAVFACIRLRAGSVANMPVQILRRIDDRTRLSATDHPLWGLFNRRPNVWQKPAQFKRMMNVHLLLRGNAYAVITRGVGNKPIALTPLHPDRVKVEQLPDLTLAYRWTRKDGTVVPFDQSEILHLVGLSLDGIMGVSPIAYAREAVGLSLAMEHHGNTVFNNGANMTGALKLPQGRTLSVEQAARLRSEIDEFRHGGAKDGKTIVLEDGLDYQQMALSAEDAQWLESREFSRTDIAMLYGVPPHMIGIVDKSTSFGTGIDSQGQNYVTYTLEDDLTTWEEALTADCLDPVRDSEIFVRFNRNALVRGDIKTRWEAHVKSLQWGVNSPNEIRKLEDENPREGGDIYYPPPNMSAAPTGDPSNVAA